MKLSIIKGCHNLLIVKFIFASKSEIKVKISKLEYITDESITLD